MPKKIIQTIVYRKKNNKLETLVLKRTKERGGFWNVINGTLEEGESSIDCRRRELFEEAGIEEVREWSDEIHRFNFSNQNQIYTVIVFAAGVLESQQVTINNEHAEYQWTSFDDAIRLMKFEDDKSGLRICREKIINNINLCPK